MSIDMKETNNINTQEKIKNEKKNFFKINIIKPKDNETNHEIQNSNKINKKRLLFSPIQIRRRSKNEEQIKNFLESSLREKRSFIKKSEDKEKEKENEKEKNYQNIIKSKTMKEKNTNNEKKNKVENLLFRGSISPTKKKILNNDINNNINNNNDILNLIKYANKLYENDQHFDKLLISNKFETNESINNKKGDSLLHLKYLPHKKRLIINFGLDDDNSLNWRKERKISNGSRLKSFSNYVNKNLRFTPKKEKEIESNKNNNNNLILDNKFMCSNKSNKSNRLINNNGDLTSKSSKFYASKGKIVKKQILDIGENALKDKDKDKEKDKIKINKKNTSKTNKSKNKKKESINSNRNQTNDCDILKKQNTENKNKLKKKKNLFCLFCCLNYKQNDSGEL